MRDISVQFQGDVRSCQQDNSDLIKSQVLSTVLTSEFQDKYEEKHTFTIYSQLAIKQR